MSSTDESDWSELANHVPVSHEANLGKLYSSPEDYRCFAGEAGVKEGKIDTELLEFLKKNAYN